MLPDTLLTGAQKARRDLSADFIKKLIETAIELHDRQKELAHTWKVWVPVLAVIVAGMANIFVTLYSNKNRSIPNEVLVYPKDIPFDHFYISIQPGTGMEFHD